MRKVEACAHLRRALPGEQCFLTVEVACRHLKFENASRECHTEFQSGLLLHLPKGLAEHRDQEVQQAYQRDQSVCDVGHHPKDGIRG